jgi:hypothetical protein
MVARVLILGAILSSANAMRGFLELYVRWILILVHRHRAFMGEDVGQRVVISLVNVRLDWWGRGVSTDVTVAPILVAMAESVKKAMLHLSASVEASLGIFALWIRMSVKPLHALTVEPVSTNLVAIGMYTNHSFMVLCYIIVPHCHL